MITRLPSFLLAGRAVSALSFTLVACTVAGCSSSSPGPNEAPRAETSAALSAPQAAVKAKRQISQRSPYGDLAAAKNLLLDGDLELEQDSGSPAWWMTNADGSFAEALQFKSGAQCRSGLYCADVVPGQTIENGYAAVRPDSTGTLTLVAKPAGACSDVHAELDLYVSADGSVYDPFVAAPTSSTPGRDGWCSYAVTFAADRAEYLGVGVLVSSASEALVDDVVLLETPAGHERLKVAHEPGAPERGRALMASFRRAHERRDRIARPGVDRRLAKRAPRPQ